MENEEIKSTEVTIPNEESTKLATKQNGEMIVPDRLVPDEKLLTMYQSV